MATPILLFDLDGTLVQTIDAYAHAVMQVFTEAGMPMKKEQFDDFYKRPLHLEGMLKQYGKTEDDLPQIRHQRDERYKALLRKETEWLPGAKDVMDQLLEKNMTMGLITGSHMSYIDAIEVRLKIKQYFKVIITADEMGQFMKPHPHGMFLAADRLGVLPEECIYVGDQWFDMEAAKLAGMQAWLVKGPYTPEGADARADRVLTSLSDIESLLAKGDH